MAEAKGNVVGTTDALKDQVKSSNDTVKNSSSSVAESVRNTSNEKASGVVAGNTGSQEKNNGTVVKMVNTTNSTSQQTSE